MYDGHLLQWRTVTVLQQTGSHQNDLGTDMGQDRLSCLCLLSNESNNLKNVDFIDIMKDFVDAKCRRKF